MMLLSCIAFADIEDKLINFSISGSDCYADGTPVMVGECYALVWSPQGKTFSGFNADGTAVSSGDRVVMAAPLAIGKDHPCQFQVPKGEYAELEGGEWAVCLVDTRKADGTPAGVVDDVPLRVNRWGFVGSNVNVSSASALTSFLGGSKSAKSPVRSGAKAASVEEPIPEDDGETGGEAGACASELSAVPATATTPQVTKFEIVNGRAKLTVADTVPYLTYTLSAGETPFALATDAAADAVDGNPGAEIEIETDATDTTRFFRVTRAE